MKFRAAVMSTALLLALPAQATTVVVNPATCRSGTFEWTNGLGQIVQIDGITDTNNMFFGVNANAGDTISAFLQDCCIAGDQFALFLNGVQLVPTATSTPGGNFNYSFQNIALAQGSNLFNVQVTALAAGFTSGGASYQFSAVTPGVPEPATWAMMLLGFGAIGAGMRHRRKPSVSVRFA